MLLLHKKTHTRKEVQQREDWVVTVRLSGFVQFRVIPWLEGNTWEN